MAREEKVLYHQIHPLKLLIDATAGFAALPLLSGATVCGQHCS